MRIARSRILIVVGVLFVLSSLVLGLLAYRKAQERIFWTDFAVSNPQEIAQWLAEAKSNPHVNLLEWTSKGEQPIPIERLDSAVAHKEWITVRRYLEPEEFLLSVRALTRNGYPVGGRYSKYEGEAQRHRFHVVLLAVSSAIILLLGVCLCWWGWYKMRPLPASQF